MSYFQRLQRCLASGFIFRALLFLSASLGWANFAAGQNEALTPSKVAGAYECSDKYKMVLFSDGRWLKGRGFDFALFKITWLDAPSPSFRSSPSFRARQVHFQRVHGRFQIYQDRPDRIVLFTQQPGIPRRNGTYWGQMGAFARMVPDADWVFEREFRVDRISGEFEEVPRYKAQEPSRCRRDGLF